MTDAFGNPVGRYRVVLYKDAQDGQLFTLVSQGTSSSAKATVQATFRISNTGYLEQAIFAGTGQANKWLNGGATIRGGVYVVGSPGNPDQTVIDANGNFALYNWYDLNTYSGITDRVESPYRQVQDLCASLRVQYGKIAVGGSTQIGEPNNRVKGVFVGRGAQDITGQNVDVCQNNKGVCTEAMGGLISPARRPSRPWTPSWTPTPAAPTPPGGPASRPRPLYEFSAWGTCPPWPARLESPCPLPASRPCSPAP